jgi:hypothetical protein
MTGPRATEFPALTESEIASIAPVKDGKPDTYNYLPTRFISEAEAKFRHWKHFYVGDVCEHGHKAPRYISNPRQCVDCHRLRERRPTIGGKGNAEYTSKITPYSERKSKREAGIIVPVQPRPLEPDAREKRFLVEYARLRDFNVAANFMGVDPAIFRAALSYSKVFLDAVNSLEDQLGLSRSFSVNEEFEWDDDKRRILVQMYVNTGDLGLARDAIQVSNSAYQAELQENADFAQQMDEAEPLAARVMEEVAVRRARNGDGKLLERWLTANMADKYGQKLKVDMNVTEKMTDAQVNARLLGGLHQLAELFRSGILAPAVSTAIPVEFTEVAGTDASAGTAEADGNGVYSDSADQPQSNLDLL